MTEVNIERPPFNLISKLDEAIEIRSYPSLKWACTNTYVNLINDQRNNMFMTLFGYISGQNDSNSKISMTAPVLTEYKSSQKEPINQNSSCQVSMKFFVPQSKQNNTPQPTGDAYVTKEQEMVVAVIRFGGFASLKDYIHYRDILINRLGEEAKHFDTVNMITAGYDAPFKQHGRTNEVWLRKIC